MPVVDSSIDAENPDWTCDPNEPRYCICNQVSYGDMVACDNEDVSSGIVDWYLFIYIAIKTLNKKF